jgi:putative transposase
MRMLEQLIQMPGKTAALRMDYGTEFTSIAFAEWCEERKIESLFIEPGKPDQNIFIERFNRTYREEALDAHLFDSISQVREITEAWIPECNEERPHDSLGCVPH